ncbi:MAG: hypothetical protein J0H31_29765 [Alphaproteobacteria bacterium]|nr:hypothetical protein [Alphaproteobacteria bacterium]
MDLEIAKLIDAEAFEMGPGYWGRQPRRDAAFETAETIKGMTMPTDRVRFKLSDVDKNHAANARAAKRAFGLTLTEAYNAVRTEQVIICRPCQFARFLIWRSEEVDGNRFKQLEAELLPPLHLDYVLDVTRNAA